MDESPEATLAQFRDILIINVNEGEGKPYKCGSGFFRRIGPIPRSSAEMRFMCVNPEELSGIGCGFGC